MAGKRKWKGKWKGKGEVERKREVKRKRDGDWGKERGERDGGKGWGTEASRGGARGAGYGSGSRTVGRKLPTLETFNDRIGVNQSAARDVEQSGALAHLVDGLGIDHVLGGGEQRHVQRDDISLRRDTTVASRRSVV